MVAVFAGCSFDLPSNDLVKCSESSATCGCLKPDSVCVRCTADDLRSCTGATPVCGNDYMCRGCIRDDECSSNACLEDGT
ncbi:MAG TPA: hypothetical protein VN253_08580 [Kofleriaceae bacterium]|nr:hypothetical protein [Kofleriaceae bacterium]